MPDHSNLIAHRLMKRRFDGLRERLEQHKAKGSAFQAAVERLEQRFEGEVECPEEEKPRSAATPSTPSNAPG